MTTSPKTHADVRIEQHSITTRDETLIHATLYRPPTPNDHAVIIASAMGVKQTYYRHYATYLAEQGFVVLTFDYRGIGQSGNGNLWGDKSTLYEWGSQDLQAMLTWLFRQYPAHDVSLVVHSISGQLIGLADSIDRVQAVLGISAQNIYWRRWHWQRQIQLFVLWYLALPISSFAAGYFPAKRFGLGESTPKGVARDWSRVARSPYGLLDVYGGSLANHFAEFRGTMRLYSFADDTFAPPQTVDELVPMFPNARHIERVHIAPAERGLAEIGHHGFFRETMRDVLWDETADYLLNPMPDIEENEPPSEASA